jgi:predicted PurR-regulated permease PerM
MQFLISFATGILVWLALWLIGIDFAVTWGALAFLLNFIPNIGSIAASIPPIAIAFAQYYPDFWHPTLTIVALLAIQLTMGNFISPKLMGDKLELSPVVILLSLLFWGWLWGITGALLSTPIASAIKIICQNVDALHPIAVMMATGRPPTRG